MELEMSLRGIACCFKGINTICPKNPSNKVQRIVVKKWPKKAFTKGVFNTRGGWVSFGIKVLTGKSAYSIVHFGPE